MAFHDFVPEKLKIALLLMTACFFQLSGGIYMGSVSHMVGSLAMMQEDIMMCGYATFAGMTIVFPLLFRLKFRFTSRTILITCAAGMITCNLITAYVPVMPVMVVTCFIAGIFRMWGTFECLSNVQLHITPSRDFTVFFPVVYFIVLGSIQINGLITAYTDYFSNWQMMHLFIIGCFLFVLLYALLLMRPFRFMKRLPLFGIDWAGASLWSLLMLLVIFVAEYGKFYDWLDAPEIRLGMAGILVTAALCIFRMFTAKRPFIEPAAWRYKNLGKLIIAFFVLCIFLSTPNVLQNAYVGSVLHFDTLNTIKLNWAVMGGVVAGAALCYWWFSKKKLSYNAIVFFGFFCVFMYQLLMYTLIDTRTSLDLLVLPSFFRGMGHMIIYTALTIYITTLVPFNHFFQVLCIIGFIRTGIASPIGSSLFSNWMHHTMADKMMVLSNDIDIVNPYVGMLDFGGIAGALSRNAVLASVKEIYGWVALVALVLLAALALMKPIYPMVSPFPKFKTIRRYIRHQIRIAKTEEK